MTTYEFSRIARLAESLDKAGIEPEIAGRILEGGERIRKGAKNDVAAAWMKGAMDRMDQLLDPATRYAVRQDCACCLGGKRLQLSKAIARNHATLEERIRAANETPFVFGHSVTQQEDGTIRVQFFPDGLESYRCPCMPKAAEPFSITYCYCCGGHVKHHLQIALGRTLDVEVIHTALSSGGKRPCTFAFAVRE